MLSIALILIAMVAMAALDLWAFWALGERDDRRRRQRRESQVGLAEIPPPLRDAKPTWTDAGARTDTPLAPLAGEPVDHRPMNRSQCRIPNMPTNGSVPSRAWGEMGACPHSLPASRPTLWASRNQFEEIQSVLTVKEHTALNGSHKGVDRLPREQICLLVVDDHPAVRTGLRGLLDDQSDFELVDAVGSAEAVLCLAEHEAIDVAVVDYQLDGRNGLWVSRKLKRLPAPPRVLIYSAYADGVLAAACVAAEADALLSKGTIGSELCDAIRGVARGRLLLPPLPQPLGMMMRERLDGEEQAIFGMLSAGIAPLEIAQLLGISSAGLESRLWTPVAQARNALRRPLQRAPCSRLL
jgi:two-component system response regulator DevR